MVFWAVCCFFCERVPYCWPVESCSCEWCCMWTHALATLGSYWKPSPSLFVFAYLGFGFGLVVFFFCPVCFLFFHSSNVARWGHEVTTGFPTGKAKETKWPTVSHFVPTQPAGCMQASRWSGLVLPQSSPCSRRLKSLSETRGPDFPLRSPACPWHILAPTHGTAAIQRLKAVSAFKGATLLFYGFLLPLLHFIQCSLINQISSSKLRSLSSYSLRQALCLPVLKAEIWPCSGIFALQMLRNLGGGAPTWVVCWGSDQLVTTSCPEPC